MRGVHVALALLLIFLTVNRKGLRNDVPRWYDVVLGLIASGAALYPSFNLNYITQRFLYVDPLMPMDIVVRMVRPLNPLTSTVPTLVKPKKAFPQRIVTTATQ